MTVFATPAAHNIVRVQATTPKESPTFWTRRIIITHTDGKTEEISLFSNDEKSLFIEGSNKKMTSRADRIVERINSLTYRDHPYYGSYAIDILVQLFALAEEADGVDDEIKIAGEIVDLAGAMMQFFEARQ